MSPLLRARLRAAARALLGTLVRHLLTMAGTALVTRGLVDQGTVDGIMPMAVEEIAGAVLAAIGIGWGQARAYLSHTRWAKAWAALTAQEEAPPPPASADPAQP